jgi:hypothetical protein
MSVYQMAERLVTSWVDWMDDRSVESTVEN